MAFTDICFGESQANGIWEIPIGTAPGAPVAPGLSIVDTLAAIKAKTDNLTFTVTNQVDANIQSVNDVTVNGDGEPGTPWGP
jgi:hypothetical protein